ncbi:MAG: hypothetical protein JXA18_13745 [Chitinispirillaceae bacterium]|nr:hypothetical protein [Chitinispirillaceae bacterium]
MKIKIIYFKYLILLLPIHCTEHIASDLHPIFCGRIIDNKNNSIESAKIEVVTIEDVGHESTNSFIGRSYYSDNNGEFCLDLPGGVEWNENDVLGWKKFTKYIKSVTIQVSKASFKDTVVTFQNANYEESRIYIDIVLENNMK